jgi:hypothetical protein
MASLATGRIIRGRFPSLQIPLYTFTSGPKKALRPPAIFTSWVTILRDFDDDGSTKGYGGRITNWFADPDIKHGAPPIGVMVIDGADSATLVGTVVTVAVPVQPDGALYEVTLGLVFA